MATSVRNIRRAATKRTFLATIEESKQDNVHPPSNSIPIFQTSETAVDRRGRGKDIAGEVFLPNSLEGISKEAVSFLIEDIESLLKKRQESIRVKAHKANNEQQQALFLGTRKLEKSVRKMTIKRFNQVYGNNIDIRNLIKNLAADAETSTLAKAAMRADGAGNDEILRTKNASAQLLTTFKTPARGVGSIARTPGTVLRTVARGETLFSANGSPVDEVDVGTVVATISKRQKDNHGAVFDLNVGDGRYVDISDPRTMQHLDQQMRATAISQLKVLKDQMSVILNSLEAS